ncbi:MAG TPA: hypothetical protein PJ997_01795 [Candidatus Paceibacterota bacterium]|nr:hypothetical protein [Candidatus Paceibacterota bacterium]HMP19051.1 hypothetical protein [Candidatus Paceibacterota bacterium]HMP85436.1 hypothetical protein [Candidatus Paceibacterota bacterium]
MKKTLLLIPLIIFSFVFFNQKATAQLLAPIPNQIITNQEELELEMYERAVPRDKKTHSDFGARMKINTEQRKENLKKRIDEKKISNIEFIVEQISDRLIFILEKIENISIALEDKIKDLKEKEIDVSVAEEKLSVSKQKIEIAKNKISNLEDEIYLEILNEKINRAEVQRKIQEARMSVIEARQSLKDVLEEIKNQIK